MAVAPTGRIYISDPGNNRVLGWPDADAFIDGDAADLVLGQPDFETGTFNTGGLSASTFNLPQGVWVDADENLWVADAFNNRVLRFNNPDIDATPTVADLVIGQPDFFNNAQNLGNGDHGTDVALPDSLQFPGRVWVSGPDVWIADSGNSRVLHYTAPTSNKPFADRVFGQFDDFTHRAKNNDGAGNNGTSASPDNLYNPIGIAVDHAGRLLIADWMNHRIVRYDNPLTSDTTADAVYGQGDLDSRQFDSGGPATGLQFPIDLAVDTVGRLFAVDSGNNRVIVYSNPMQFPLPDAVFGQLGLLAADSENHGLSLLQTDADGLWGPTGVATDSAGNVYVVDTNNMRVLRYDTPFGLGDLNCDALLSMDDIAALSLALVDETAYDSVYGCDKARADCDRNGEIDGRDVAAFVDLIVNQN